MEEELKEKLFNKKDNGWESLDSNQKRKFWLIKKIYGFLNVAKQKENLSNMQEN